MQLSSLLLAGQGKSLTSLFSLLYLILFLPACIIGYTVIPKNWKKYFLLLASYGFFWLISGELLIYLILTTFSVHYFGIWLDRINGQMKEALAALPKEERKGAKAGFVKKQRLVVALAVVLHIGLLLVLKYSPFFTTNVNLLLNKMGLSINIEIPKYLMPIGISFFTLQAVSYIVDVYRGVTKADDNLFRLALFMSFFPQIIEGPICRYNQTAEQLWNVKPIEYKNLTFGIQRILYGMLKKIVIADRLNLFVSNIFDKNVDYEGGIIAIGAICYTVQLYMDFSGSMDAVVGTAEIFGVVMPENFQRPFFSKTISEFWKRWHITLGAWFKDYIFYPVTSAKKMKKLTSGARKKLGNHYGPLIAGSIALFCVWFCNGLWHGSAWSFIFFGMYHFVLILIGNMLEPPVQTMNKKLHINPKWFVYRLLQILRTCVLVVIGELFFRARGLKAGMNLFTKMVSDFSFTTLNDDLLKTLSADKYDFIIVGVTLLIILTVSILNEKGICIRGSLAKRNIVLRWCLLYALLLYIIIFGAYGLGYKPVDPMYAQF
ncbi:D-alanyl-lipoteichoic acid acyltransferase DltB, MBOAT superfamily [Ruminococcaceae bacterium FB2012]|nr:D-alanyl-lipoteichoic acid acyltransferase DltB, MBOAT superfamily [Ruminococcaceae bacterium FB2012]